MTSSNCRQTNCRCLCWRRWNNGWWRTRTQPFRFKPVSIPFYFSLSKNTTNPRCHMASHTAIVDQELSSTDNSDDDMRDNSQITSELLQERPFFEAAARAVARASLRLTSTGQREVELKTSKKRLKSMTSQTEVITPYQNQSIGDRRQLPREAWMNIYVKFYQDEDSWYVIL